MENDPYLDQMKKQNKQMEKNNKQNKTMIGLNVAQTAIQAQTAKNTKQLLNESIKQTQEMQALNDQMRAANQVQRQILENQMKESEEKQKQKFFKDYIFYVGNFLDIFKNITDNFVKYSIGAKYFPSTIDFLNLAIEEISELNDKQSANNLLKEIKSHQTELSGIQEEFNKSELKSFIENGKEFNNINNNISNLNYQKNDLLKSKKKVSNKNPYIVLTIIFLVLTIIFVALSFLSVPLFEDDEIGQIFVQTLIWTCIITFVVLSIVFGIKASKRGSIMKAAIINNEEIDEKVNNIENNLSIISKDLNNIEAQYNSNLDIVNNKYPSFLNVDNEINSLFDKFNNKWNISVF